jgi:hypothetical protein
MVIAGQAPQICPPTIPFCSRFDSVLFTPKMPAIAGRFNFSRSPLLALAGGMLYLFDPAHLIPYTGGLLVLGGWLAVFYREHIRERDEQGEPNVGLVVLLVNVHAYLLGAIALALPNWIAVGTTVAAVLLLVTGCVNRRIDGEACAGEDKGAIEAPGFV